MTKAEAIANMKQGEKITHSYFSSKEWITMKDGKIVTEDGYTHSTHDFWSYRTSNCWNSGYSIY